VTETEGIPPLLDSRVDLEILRRGQVLAGRRCDPALGREGRREGAVRGARRGLGIPPGERQRIFEKFYRLDPNLTRGIGGTGLGLYICRELVDRMGGRLSVTANGDRGSSFVVELPTA
jgi:signal transduction histidine kinase